TRSAQTRSARTSQEVPRPVGPEIDGLLTADQRSMRPSGIHAPRDRSHAACETIGLLMAPPDASSRQNQPKKSALARPSSANSALELAKRLLWPALLLCIGFAVYSRSLKFDFILDDHRFTVDPRIQESGHIFDYFSSYVWAQFTGGPPSFY